MRRLAAPIGCVAWQLSPACSAALLQKSAESGRPTARHPNPLLMRRQANCMAVAQPRLEELLSGRGTGQPQAAPEAAAGAGASPAPAAAAAAEAAGAASGPAAGGQQQFAEPGAGSSTAAGALAMLPDGARPGPASGAGSEGSSGAAPPVGRGAPVSSPRDEEEDVSSLRGELLQMQVGAVAFKQAPPALLACHCRGRTALFSNNQAPRLTVWNAIYALKRFRT